jgi:hypothetical protein
LGKEIHTEPSKKEDTTMSATPEWMHDVSNEGQKNIGTTPQPTHQENTATPDWLSNTSEKESDTYVQETPPKDTEDTDIKTPSTTLDDVPDWLK